MAKRLLKCDNDWQMNGKDFKISWEDIQKNKYFGFVYLIEEIETGMKYIGEKSFISFRKPAPGKNKKRFDEEFLRKLLCELGVRI